MIRPSKIVASADGSATLFVPALQEHYHSVHGALNESRHVFIQAGLLHSELRTLRIFEMGFGTGLNALLTCMEAISRNLNIRYDTIDKFPLGLNMVRKLNYAGLLSEGACAIFNALHSCTWNEPHLLDPVFTLTKFKADILTFKPESMYDIIYFDAFSPRAQPELWGIDVFRKMFNMLHPGGLLTTYSATGWVRKNMEEVGFQTEKIPGPTGKREMLRSRR